MTDPLDVRDADRWWHELPPARRVSYWRWLAKPPDDTDTPGQMTLETASGERLGADLEHLTS